MKYVSIDIETTGLSPQEHDIVEFGAVCDDLTVDKPIEQLAKFHCYFVKSNYAGSPFALSMHPQIFKRIAKRTKPYKYVGAMKFGNLFKQFLLKNGYEGKRQKVCITAAGKNFASFDLQFLLAKTDIARHIKIGHRIIDPSILFLQKGDEKLPATSECKKRMQLEETVAHTAIEDAIDVIKMVRYKLSSTFC